MTYCAHCWAELPAGTRGRYCSDACRGGNRRTSAALAALPSHLTPYQRGAVRAIERPYQAPRCTT